MNAKIPSTNAKAAKSNTIASAVMLGQMNAHMPNRTAIAPRKASVHQFWAKS